MGVGHLAVAVVLKKVDPKINLGLLAFAALFADFLLGLLVMLGLEQVHIPEDFSSLHYLTFTFPYSHGLAASLFWSLAAYLSVRFGLKQGSRAGMVTAAAVFSHFVLDVIVHIPELPLAGSGSPLLGLGLWNHLGAALLLETILAVIALVVYLRFIPDLSRTNRLGVVALLIFMAIMTITGQALATQAPPASMAAISWIIETLLISGLIFWLERPQGKKFGTFSRPNRISS
jgi:hypothetical protein